MSTPKLSLYEVGAEALQIEDLLIASEGELSPELEQRWNDLLTAGTDKVNAAACVVKSLEAHAEVCELESTRLAKRAEALQADADRLKERIKVAVDLAFNGKVKTALFTIWAQSSAPSVSYSMSPDIMPDVFAARYPDFSRISIELNKAAVNEAAKSGAVIPPEIVATEHPATRYLRIK